jgi:hypothetical protein
MRIHNQEIHNQQVLMREIEWETEFGSFLKKAAKAIAPLILTTGLALRLGQNEPITRGRFLQEYEAELDFLQEVSPAVLMELLASSAVEAESEAEASQLLRSMLPFAAHLQPQTASSQVFPPLDRIMTVASRVLYPDPKLRPVLRLIPAILHDTIARLNQRLAQEQFVTPQAIVQIFKDQIHQMLDNSQRAIRTLQRSNFLLQETAAAYTNDSYITSKFENQWLFEAPLSSITPHTAEPYSDAEWKILKRLKHAAKLGVNWLKNKIARKSTYPVLPTHTSQSSSQQPIKSKSAFPQATSSSPSPGKTQKPSFPQPNSQGATSSAARKKPVLTAGIGQPLAQPSKPREIWLFHYSPEVLTSVAPNSFWTTHGTKIVDQVTQSTGIQKDKARYQISMKILTSDNRRSVDGKFISLVDQGGTVTKHEGMRASVHWKNVVSIPVNTSMIIELIDRKIDFYH